jgi:hypothetical protein
MCKALSLTKTIQEQIQTEHDLWERGTAKAKRKKLEAADIAVTDKVSNQPVQRTMDYFTTSAASAEERADAVRMEISRFFFDANVPFASIENPHLTRAITLAWGKSFKLMNRRQLGNEYLDNVAKVSTQEATAQFHAASSSRGFTLASDGWSTRNNFGFVNYILVTKGLSLHHKTTWELPSKKAHDIASDAKVVIEEIGPSNVVQVCMDGANMAAMELLERDYPHIIYTWCAAHSLDLLLEDMCKHEELGLPIKMARSLIGFIMNHRSLLQEFLISSKDVLLCRPGATRFATNYIAITRLLEQRQSVLHVLGSKVFDEWYEVQSRESKACADEIIKTCSIPWFKSLENIKLVMQPVYNLLRRVDGVALGLAGKVHYELFLLQERFNDETLQGILHDFSSDCKAHIRTKFALRWEKMHSDIYTAGYILDPEFQNEAIFKQNCEENMRPWRKLIRRLFPEPGMFEILARELILYQDQHGSFSEGLLSPSLKRDAHLYWATFGGDAPNLQRLAIRIFSQPVSSSASERNWSLFSWVLGQRRFKLAPEKLNKLVSIRMHELLKQQASNASVDATSIPWVTENIDAAGDKDDDENFANAVYTTLPESYDGEESA